jgi:ADP-heptose:LPS heptosyltransferase
MFAMPAMEALRAAYPDAEIVYLGLQWHQDFLEDRPGPVDQVIVVPPSRGVGYPDDWEGEDEEELNQFFDRMVAENFDVALQMHGGGRYSNLFIKRLGARITVGLRTPEAAPLDMWVPYIFYQPEILRYLEVVSLLGAEQVTLMPRIAVTQKDLDDAREILPESSQPLAVIHPGAGDERRRWPVEKFAAVGNALAWSGAQVVVVGSEADQTLDQSVIDTMASEAFNLAGKLSINGLTGLLSRASVVVSNDSGPLHLAAATGAPTVGIYWCGNMITAGPVTRAKHRPAISWRLDCPVCGLDNTKAICEHRESFVADVPQEEVIAPALELLQMTRETISPA